MQRKQTPRSLYLRLHFGSLLAQVHVSRSSPEPLLIGCCFVNFGVLEHKWGFCNIQSGVRFYFLSFPASLRNIKCHFLFWWSSKLLI